MGESTWCSSSNSMDADIGYEFSAENVVSDSKLFDYLTEAGANHFQEDASDGSGDDDHSGTPAQPEETEDDRGSIWSAVLHKRTGSFGLGIREVPETQTLLVQLVQNHGAVSGWRHHHSSELPNQHSADHAGMPECSEDRGGVATAHVDAAVSTDPSSACDSQSLVSQRHTVLEESRVPFDF